MTAEICPPSYFNLLTQLFIDISTYHKGIRYTEDGKGTKNMKSIVSIMSIMNIIKSLATPPRYVFERQTCLSGWNVGVAKLPYLGANYIGQGIDVSHNLSRNCGFNGEYQG